MRLERTFSLVIAIMLGIGWAGVAEASEVSTLKQVLVRAYQASTGPNQGPLNSEQVKGLSKLVLPADAADLQKALAGSRSLKKTLADFASVGAHRDEWLSIGSPIHSATTGEVIGFSLVGKVQRAYVLNDIKLNLAVETRDGKSVLSIWGSGFSGDKLRTEVTSSRKPFFANRLARPAARSGLALLKSALGRGALASRGDIRGANTFPMKSPVDGLAALAWPTEEALEKALDTKPQLRKLLQKVAEAGRARGSSGPRIEAVVEDHRSSKGVGVTLEAQTTEAFAANKSQISVYRQGDRLVIADPIFRESVKVPLAKEAPPVLKAKSAARLRAYRIQRVRAP